MLFVVVDPQPAHLHTHTHHVPHIKRKTAYTNREQRSKYELRNVPIVFLKAVSSVLQRYAALAAVQGCSRLFIRAIAAMRPHSEPGRAALVLTSASNTACNQQGLSVNASPHSRNHNIKWEWRGVKNTETKFRSLSVPSRIISTAARVPPRPRRSGVSPAAHILLNSVPEEPEPAVEEPIRVALG